MISKKRNVFKRRPQYVPQMSRLTSKSRPYASKYGDELYIKVQKVQELRVDSAGDVYSYMRVNGSSSTLFNEQLYDQPEFQPFLPLYGFYEVRGMKAEMTVTALSNSSGAGLYAGICPGVSTTATVP